MKKLTLWAVVAVVMFVGCTVYREGAHNAFGGTFAFLAPTRPEEVLDQTFLYTDSQPTANQSSAGAPTKKVPITVGVRQRVNASMANESQRLKRVR